MIRLCPGRPAAETAAAAAAVSAAGRPGQSLIIDLTALEFIDCSGVRALLCAQGLARQAGGDMLLAAPQDSVLRLLTLLRLVGALGAHASLAAAALSAGPARYAAGPSARIEQQVWAEPSETG